MPEKCNHLIPPGANHIYYILEACKMRENCNPSNYNGANLSERAWEREGEIYHREREGELGNCIFILSIMGYERKWKRENTMSSHAKCRDSASDNIEQDQPERI